MLMPGCARAVTWMIRQRCALLLGSLVCLGCLQVKMSASEYQRIVRDLSGIGETGEPLHVICAHAISCRLCAELLKASSPATVCLPLDSVLNPLGQYPVLHLSGILDVLQLCSQ
jgi:hypothetical protein